MLCDNLYNDTGSLDEEERGVPSSADVFYVLRNRGNVNKPRNDKGKEDLDPISK